MRTDRLSVTMNRRDFLRRSTILFAAGAIVACGKESEPLPDYTLLFSAQKEKDGTYDVFRYNTKTKALLNLTQQKENEPKANHMNPQISPDGKFIVFYSDRITPQNPNGVNHIFRMNLFDLLIQQVTSGEFHHYDPRVFPDGKSLVVKRDEKEKNGHGDLVRIGWDGNVIENLTVERKSTEEWGVPQFSADGKYMYFVSRLSENLGTKSDELFRLNLQSGETIQLTQNNFPDWYPAVNPQTNVIVYVSKALSDKKGSDKLYVIDPEQSTSEPFPFPGQPQSGDNGDPSWNTNGDVLTFINNSSGKYLLHTINAQGENLSRFEIPEIKGNILSPVFV